MRIKLQRPICLDCGQPMTSTWDGGLFCNCESSPLSPELAKYVLMIPARQDALCPWLQDAQGGESLGSSALAAPVAAV